MKNSFGEFLKQKRIEKNFTQKDLANILFVSESAVSKWEKDVARPDINLLPKLAEILGVSEHELITASIDNSSKQEKIQAKKWRTFSFSWNLFWIISYVITLIPCFICDLAINHGLTWFWIVASALLLAFTFTNLPRLIKKHKLILSPLSMYLSLCLLLGVCCIYTKGDWFFVATLSILLGMTIVFVPIYIQKFKCFEKIKKHGDFVSLSLGFIILNILLVVIDFFSVSNRYTNEHWYLKTALPLTLIIYLVLNILIAVRFLKINRFFKTSIVLTLINLFVYLPPLFVRIKDKELQKELVDDMNVFNANFSSWKNNIDNNLHCIIALTLLGFSLIFLLFGIIRYIKQKNKSKNFK